MKRKTAVTRIDMVGDVNIFNVGEQRLRLLDAIAAAKEAKDIEVDLSQVTELDSAGLQLMIAAKREAVANGKALRFTGHSEAVFDILELCDLTGHFGDPVLIHSRT